MAENDKTNDRLFLGIILVLFSTLFTASQEATFKFASADMSVWQIFVLRSAFLIPIFMIIAAVWGQSAGLWREALKFWPMVRATLFVLMHFATYAAIPFLELSVIGAGLYTAPLFVAVLTPLLLQEQLSGGVFLAVLFGFCGVLVILQPGTAAFDWMVLVPVMGGLCYALSGLVVRRHLRETRPTALALSLAIALLITGLVISSGLWLLSPSQEIVNTAPFLLSGWAALNGQSWIIIALVTLLMVGNGIVQPAAYQAAPTVVVATFDYCFLIFLTLIGFVVFNEVPGPSVIIGMGMIAGAGLLIVRLTQRSSERPPASNS